MKSVFIRVYPWLLLAGPLLAADSISDALQKGLFEEEANHNFDAAIKAYQSVIDQTAEQRKLAATAVFRLGECFRKLNKTNDAVGQYQRILREYPDVTPLATLSQQNLSALGVNVSKDSATTAATSAEAEEIEKIKAMIKYSPDLLNAPHQSGMTPLSRAAWSGYLAVAGFLLDNKADVNARDNVGITPLHSATENGHRAMVELLLDRGSDVNARNKSGNQALHLAATKGYRSIVDLLLARKADVNAKGESDRTPLLAAVEGRQTAIAKLLLDRGADVNARDKIGWTALHRALGASPETAELTELILSYKPNLELQDREGYTVLATAGYRGDFHCFELLVQAGADVNAGTKMTPLLATVRAWSPERVRLLLEHKADPNQVVNGATALAWLLVQNVSSSEELRKTEIADLLRKHGAKDEGIKVAAPSPAGVRVIAPRVVRDLQAEEIERLQKLIKDSPDLINAKDNSGQTALHRAASDGQDRVSQFLLTNKAEINIQNAKKNTPLHNAVIGGQRDTVELLLANGADVNAIGSEGEAQPDRSTVFSCQALHMAVSRGNQLIAERLIAAKADVNGRDGHGRTPLRFAVNGGFQNLVTLLISKGADPNIPDDQGRTPAMLALANDFQTILHTLLDESVYLNAQDGGGNTLLHQAAEQRPPRNLQMILGKRPDLEAENKDQRTPLMVALASQNVQAARMLLEAGANPNHRNGKGQFPLFIAAANANKEAVELLLDRKADVNQKNLENGTVLGYVLAITSSAPAYIQKPLREIADLLRKHGAKEEVSSAKAKP